MAIYKPSLLDKFKDFVNGLRSNWDQYEDHVADFETAKGIITDTFDETRTYAVGDYAIYENVLYKCVEAIEEAGEWDADKWVATNIAEEFNSHLAETIEDDVHGLYTRLADFRIIRFTLNTNSSVKLKFSSDVPFMFLLLMQGTQSNAYGAFVLQGYGIGGIRYRVGEIQRGSAITVSVDAEGERSFTVSSAASAGVSCRIVMFMGSPPEII